MAVDLSPFDNFLTSLPKASNETQIRELFLVLASKGFSETNFAENLALGAEYNVSFKTQGLIRRGRVDSFVDNVLVEFKQKLAKNLPSAEDQLRGYIAGAWGEDGHYKRPYVGVATDGAVWRVYAARPLAVEQPSTKDNVELVLSDSFEVLSQDAQALRLFLNRLFFRTTLLLPTTENIVRDFGIDSPAFLTVARRLEDMLGDLETNERVRLCRRTWEKDLQIAYGSVKVSDDLFVRHTYLAVLARLLVWTTLERRNATIKDLERIYDGTYFTTKRVANFVEDDYFHWHQLDANDIAEAWKALVAQMATYDLSSVREDILKPLYEALVDPEMRHDLGEFYTPDWLAVQVVDRVVEGWNPGKRGIPRIIDPACGSGTFLRAAIHRIRAEQSSSSKKADRLEEIIASIQGIDVHPLAVVVSKATYLLAISDLIDTGGRVIHLPVYMANSLAAPARQSTQSLFGSVVPLEIGDGDEARTFEVPLDFVEDGRAYDGAIDDVVKVSRSIAATTQPSSAALSALRGRIGRQLDAYAESSLILDSLASMSQHLVDLIRRNQDTIYGFLLRNRYRSVLLYREFDLVIGNPPWLTFADIDEGPYSALLLRLNKDLKVAPRGAGQRAHTEIATIFMFHAWQHFIKHLPSSKTAPAQLAFVMPRSLFQASHHESVRLGSYGPKAAVREIWDLDGVTPLFNVPSCVILLASDDPRRHSKTIGGREYIGRLPERDPSVATVASKVAPTAITIDLAYLGKRSAWRKSGSHGVQDASVKGVFKPSFYVRRFRQGAVLYPQTLMIFQTEDGASPASGDVTVCTNEEAAATAKLARDFRWAGVVDASTVFTTYAADHLLPYCLKPNGWRAVLPVSTTPRDATFAPQDPDGLRSTGRVLTADWLDMAEAEWRKIRKPREKLPLWKRIDHLSQFSAQAGMKRYVTLYTASGARTVAAVLDTGGEAFPFVARDKTYWTSTSDEAEAHYLCAFLNSDYVHERIKDFMTRGLMGARDTHKRVLDVPWPEFDRANSEHMEAANLASGLMRQALATVDLLRATGTGRARSELRTRLSEADRARLEELVEEISEG